jgi:hypothetical protein
LVSLQFSRSLRSLKIDSFRATRVALILAIINMIVLLAWFFLGEITLYEISSELSSKDDGSVEAVFPEEAVARLYPGQPAVLRINAGPDQPVVTVPALLVGVDDRSGTAQFLLMSDDFPLSVLRGGLSGKAEIQVEVEYVTPAALVLRASGKYLNGAQIPVSPQELRPTQPS